MVGGCLNQWNKIPISMVASAYASGPFIAFWGPYATFCLGPLFCEMMVGDSKPSKVVWGRTFNIEMTQSGALEEEKRPDL